MQIYLLSLPPHCLQEKRIATFVWSSGRYICIIINSLSITIYTSFIWLRVFSCHWMLAGWLSGNRSCRATAVWMTLNIHGCFNHTLTAVPPPGQCFVILLAVPALLADLEHSPRSTLSEACPPRQAAGCCRRSATVSSRRRRRVTILPVSGCSPQETADLWDEVPSWSSGIAVLGIAGRLVLHAGSGRPHTIILLCVLSKHFRFVE